MKELTTIQLLTSEDGDFFLESISKRLKDSAKIETFFNHDKIVATVTRGETIADGIKVTLSKLATYNFKIAEFVYYPLGALVELPTGKRESFTNLSAKFAEIFTMIHFNS